MHDFSHGIELGVNEDEYQAALQKYCDGLVISLNRSRTGQFTLHKATCGTLSYGLTSKTGAKAQRYRSGKVLFRNSSEATDWLAANLDLQLGALNRCSRCMPFVGQEAT